MLPGAESVGVQPAPHRGAADLWDDALCDHLLLDIGTGESGERESETMRKFTGHGLDLGGDAGGETGGTPGPRLLFETGQTRQGKSFAPLVPAVEKGGIRGLV